MTLLGMFHSQGPDAYMASGGDFNDARHARQQEVPTTGPLNYHRVCETFDHQVTGMAPNAGILVASNEMMELLYQDTNEGWTNHPDMNFPRIGRETVTYNLSVAELAERVPFGREEIFYDLYRLIRDQRQYFSSQV